MLIGTGLDAAQPGACDQNALAGGGTFRTLPLSRHATTNVDVIRAFLPIDVRTRPEAPDSVRVEVGASA